MVFFKHLAKQESYIFFGKTFKNGVIITHQFACQRTFTLLQLQHLFLYGIAAYHAVSKDIFGLAYTVRTVYCLLFHRRVPPWVYYIYIVGGILLAITTLIVPTNYMTAVILVFTAILVIVPVAYSYSIYRKEQSLS